MSLRSHATLLSLLLPLLAAPASAQLSFVPFGARAVALGGAAVTLTEGAGSAVENPAAAGDARFAAAASVGAAASESGDFLSPLKVVTGNDPAALAAGAGNLGDVTRALRTLADPGNGVAGHGIAGAVVVSRHWALSLTESGWGGSFVRADLTHLATGVDPATSVLYNRSAGAYRALVVQDLALTRSMTFLDGIFAVGATAHLLRGTTSSKEESAFTTEAGDALQMARRGMTGVERTSTRFSLDAGALVSYGIVRVGAVVRGINEPDFPFDESAAAPLADRGASVTLGRQARVGASVHLPVVGVTVAADLDLTTNETMVPGLFSREVGGGVEWKIGPIAIRGGVAMNLESTDRTKRFSGGVGAGIGPVKADAALVYRPDRSALGGVLTARIGL